MADLWILVMSQYQGDAEQWRASEIRGSAAELRHLNCYDPDTPTPFSKTVYQSVYEEPLPGPIPPCRGGVQEAGVIHKLVHV